MSVSFSAKDFEKYANPEEFAKIVDLKTVSELISHIEKNYAEKPAIGKPDGSVASYNELILDIEKICYWLKEANIRPGSNVGVLSGNNYNFAVASLGIMAYGCVAVLLPNMLEKNAIFGCSVKYDLCGLLFESAFEENTTLAKERLTSLKFGEIATVLQENIDSNQSLINKSIAENDPACIIMTGGTTGKSKGAVLSHTALMAGMINGCYGLKNFFGNTYYCIMPLTHVFGFIRNLLTSLYTGSCIYFAGDKRRMFADIKKYKPSILVIVPALAELFLNLIKAYGKDFLGGNIATIICGAASVPPYLTKEYTDLGITFCPGYGLTEFANMVSGNPVAVDFPDSVGMLFPDQEAKLVNGELWLKGRNCMLSYYKEPEENAVAFEDGWFKTGDLARFDEQNNLYIIGRSKDVIVLQNGENVSPAYIEAKINTLPYIQDSLVTCQKNEFGAEILVAEVLPRAAIVKQLGLEGAQLAEYIQNGVIDITKELLPFEQVAKVVIRDTDFARTPAMKIVRPKKEF